MEHTAPRGLGGQMDKGREDREQSFSGMEKLTNVPEFEEGEDSSLRQIEETDMDERGRSERDTEEKGEINPFDYVGTERVRIRHMEVKEISQEDIDRVLQLTGQLEDFEILMMYYDCALAEVRTKLEILNREVALKKNRNPFESIKSRLKKPVSIYEKLKHRRIPFSVKNIEEYLTDVAGLRVICSFIDDIYSIRDSLAAQDDVKIIQEKDYIVHPKPNGYRSLHLILEVPIFLMREKVYEGGTSIPHHRHGFLGQCRAQDEVQKRDSQCGVHRRGTALQCRPDQPARPQDAADPGPH